MQIDTVTPEFSTTGQVQPEDMQAIADNGFASLICNRPDGEEPDQPDWAELDAAAQRAGLQTRYIPVGGDVSVDDQASDFAAAMRDLPKPILAFCRTGNRAKQLFQTLPERHA